MRKNTFLSSISSRTVMAGLLGLAVLLGATGAQAQWADITPPFLQINNQSFGVSWGDFDGDGDPDLFVPDLANSVLAMNLGGGIFADTTSLVGAPLDNVASGYWGDFDGDLDLDLYISRPSALLLENQGTGFVDVTPPAIAVSIPFPRGASWIDYDLDGDLDIYQTADSVPNRLYRNDGGGNFVLATPAGLDDANFGLSVAWADYDLDGDPDLYLSNLGAPNKLFQNDGAGNFTDVTPAILANLTSSVGVSWGDYDNDGDPDLYVAMSPGNNFLLRNDLGGVFTDVTAGPLVGRVNSAGGAWGDIDNDGDLDLYVSNSDLNQLLINNGGGVFVDVTAPPLDQPGGINQGAAFSDIDGDGDLDLYAAKSNGLANALFENQFVGTNFWVKIRLTGVASNTNALGARVRVVAGGLSRVRWVDGASCSNSNSDHLVHFGLATASTIDTVEVTWPLGQVEVFTSQPVNTVLAFTEQVAPLVNSITTTAAPNDSAATFSILGDYFNQDAFAVDLQGPGGTILPITITPVSDEQVDVTFNLAGAVPGSYTLNVSNAGGATPLPDALVVYAETVDLFRSTTSGSSDRFPAFPRATAGFDSLVWITDRDEGADLYIKAPFEPEVNPRKISGVNVVSPSFSPDGSELVCQLDNTGGMVVIDRVSGTSNPVPIGGTAIHPSWSPVDTRIAYADLPSGDLRVVEGPNSDLFFTIVTGDPGVFNNISPDWSPDGSELVFIQADEGGSTIYTVSSTLGEAGGLTEIYAGGSLENLIGTTWSPDGNWIAFASDANGNVDVYVVDARGEAFGLFQITTDAADDADPAWSADGSALAFASSRASVSNLDVYIATNLGLPDVTDSDGDGLDDLSDACPFLAPDFGEIDRDYDGCPDTTSSFRQVKFWSNDQLPVTYETDAVGHPDLGDEFTELEAGFNAWTAVADVVLAGGDDGTRAGPSNVALGDGRNSITFTDEDGFLFGTIAITPTAVATGDTLIGTRQYRAGETIDADMLFNTRDFEFETPGSPGSANAFSVRSVATHEFGHFFGFAHSSVSTGTMFYVVPRGIEAQTLVEDDIVLARRGYADPAPQLTIEGQVFRPNSEAGVVGAAVFAISDLGDTLQMTFSGIEGHYRFYELSEPFRVFIHPLDGSPNVNGLVPGAVNSTLELFLEDDFLPEFYDQGAETDTDFNTTGTLLVPGGLPILNADIITNTDSAPPTVLFTNPANGELAAPVGGAVLIQFSERIDKAAFAANPDFSLRDVVSGAGIQGAAAVLSGDSVLAFTPSAPLGFATDYRLIVGPNILDVSGNSMAAPDTTLFTTEIQPPLDITGVTPSEAPVGGTFVFSGVGFEPDAGSNFVDFSGNDVSTVTPVSSTTTELVVTVPPGAESGTVFISTESFSDTISVVILPPKSPPSGTFVDEVALSGDPRKMSLTSDGTQAYVATDQGVVAVDLEPAGFLGTAALTIPGGCTGVAPLGTLMLAVGPTSPELRAIATALNTVVEDAVLFGSPLGIAPVPGKNQVVITYADRAVLHDATTGAGFGTELTEWSSVNYGFTGDVSLSPSGAEAYATTSDGRIAVLSLVPGQGIVALLPAGTSPGETAVTPAGNIVVSGDGSGVARTYAIRGPLAQTLTVPGGFSGMAMSPEGSFAFGANFILNQIEVLDLQNGGLLAAESFETGIDPRDVATSIGGRYVYVITGDADLFQVFDTQSSVLVDAIAPTSGGPGTLITISGTGFDPVAEQNQVFLNGLAHTPILANAAGTSIVIRQDPIATSGAISVTAFNQNSNTKSYKVVNRPDPGIFQRVDTADIGDPFQLGNVLESPDGRFLIVLHQDGAISVLQGNPTQPNFLRSVQELTGAQAGLSGSGDMIMTPDGGKLYVEDTELDELAIFEVSAAATNPLTRAGEVLEAVGSSPLSIDVDGLGVSPDGSRLFVRDQLQGRVVEVSISADQEIGSLSGFTQGPSSLSIHPNGLLAYVGDLIAGVPQVVVVDIDPASANYRQPIQVIALGERAGPFQLEASPDGTRLYCLVEEDVINVIQLGILVVDIDPASATVHTVTQPFQFLALDDRPILRPNRSGTVLYYLDKQVGGGLRGLDAATLSSYPAGPSGGRVLVSSTFEISRDDGRLYYLDGAGGIGLTDATPIAGLDFLTGQNQVGVVGQPLPAPIVTQGYLTAGAPVGNPGEGSLLVYEAAVQGGNFGFPDLRAYVATDANGQGGANYIAGTVEQIDQISVISAAGTIVADITVVGDTSQVAPSIVATAPSGDPNARPGVNTLVAVDFSKSINTATVNGTSFFIRPVGGALLPVTYTFADQNRRAVLKPKAALEYSTAYEFVLINTIADTNGLLLTNGQTVAFTTEDPVALELHAVKEPATKVGNSVVLSGDGFDPVVSNNSVLFSGTAAVPAGGDPGALLVTVPFGALSGPVRVIAGSDTSNAKAFVVLAAQPSPVNEEVDIVDVPVSGQQITIVADGSRAYMTSAGANSVVPINIPQVASENPIPVGMNPFGITSSPSGDRVYVSNFFSNTLSVIDADSTSGTFKNVIATIPTLGQNPTGVAVNPDGRTLYVVHYGDSTMTFIDTDSTSAAQYSARASANTGSGSQTVVVTPDGALVVAGTATGIIVINAADGSARSSTNTGSGSQTVAVTPDGGLAVVLTKDDQLILIDIQPGSPTEGQARSSTNTGSGSQSVAVTPDGGFAYVTLDSGIVEVYQIVVTGGAGATSPDGVTSPFALVLVTTFDVGENPKGLAFDPSGSGLLLVVNTGDQTVSFINATGPPTIISAEVDADPNTLNLNSNGKFISAAVEFPDPFVPEDVDQSTVLLNGVVAPDSSKTAIADTDENGVLELLLKFPRSEVIAIIAEGQNAEIRVTGVVDGFTFVAVDSIRILRPKIKAPTAGSLVAPALPTEIEWDPIQTGPAAAVDIYWSQDLGESWDVVVQGTTDDSAYTWDVPDISASQVLLRIVALDDKGKILGYGQMEEPFAIAISLDGREPALPARFALLPAAPNPFADRANIRFDLPEDAPVTLQIFNVDGSLVRVLAEGTPYPAGRHAVLWDGQNGQGQRVSGGIYFVRIQTDVKNAVQKIVRLK